MKLKFQLKCNNIENLQKILQHASTIWKADDDVLFYFDTDQMIIYPKDKKGFDKIYTRIRITNHHSKKGDEITFFNDYTIKSNKEKSSILIRIKNLDSFIGDLKVLVEMNSDAQFKLTQSQDDSGQMSKFLEVIAHTGDQNDEFKFFQQIDAIFDQSQYPQEIQEKEIQFMLDQSTCLHVLEKFTSRLAFLNDETCQICFRSASKEHFKQQSDAINVKNTNNQNIEGGIKDLGENDAEDEQDSQKARDDNSGNMQEYEMELRSQKMCTQVMNRGYPADFKDVQGNKNQSKAKYKIILKKDIFISFFNIIKKQTGIANLKIQSDEMLEMEYELDKCPFMSIIFETPARNI